MCTLCTCVLCCTVNGVQVLIKSLQDCMATIEDDYNSRYPWKKGKGGEGRRGERKGGEGRGRKGEEGRGGEGG